MIGFEYNLDNTTLSTISDLSSQFGYELNAKKAKANLIKGAERDTFTIDEKQKCSMLLFSAGAFLGAVNPIIFEWNNEVKVKHDDLKIEIEEVLPSYVEKLKHVETIVTFKVISNKVVVTCYNTTQKIKVEGKGYQEFVHSTMLSYL